MPRDNEYSLDKCAICDKYKALKNGVCVDCDKETELPDFFKDLFNQGEQE